jgi:hypothetical protein
MDEPAWITGPRREWQLAEREGAWRLGFLYGRTCPCWVELLLTDAELAAVRSGDSGTRALIAAVQADEPRYRSRLTP